MFRLVTRFSIFLTNIVHAYLSPLVQRFELPNCMMLAYSPSADPRVRTTDPVCCSRQASLCTPRDVWRARLVELSQI